MTPRKPLNELKRRNRAFGEGLRALIRCPLCSDHVSVVAYRRSTIRLECGQCGLRFSVDGLGFDAAVRRLSDSGLEPSPDRLMALLCVPRRPKHRPQLAATTKGEA
jgi:hypothetical protein